MIKWYKYGKDLNGGLSWIGEIRVDTNNTHSYTHFPYGREHPEVVSTFNFYGKDELAGYIESKWWVEVEVEDYLRVMKGL